MSYQVLARKWRPRSFATLVGQEHVVQALTHALSEQRLHHAYLFTGTRGVGKTTIARILAKSLNCETGITATPCGVCQACREIDAGRFVDLLEVDAATNTRVDEMRQLLDNAVYAPTRGRFKVYVIDEVHMLSTSAFNAMLKTLEEPPEHVKFILATTDPQKIPVTVLSRCLQFNLKQMAAFHISGHLSHILQAEGVPFEEAALHLIARAASGSMRDALSLLDQAIAHGAGQVSADKVGAMLGVVGQEHVLAILEAVLAGDAGELMRLASELSVRGFSYSLTLQHCAALISRLQVVKLVPQSLDEQDPDRPALLRMADRMTSEFLQLAYQILIHGRQELPLAPDEYSGFMMALLRLLAFRPATVAEILDSYEEVPSRGAPSRVSEPPAAPSVVTAAPVPPVASPPSVGDPAAWSVLVEQMRLSGLVRELALNCTLLSMEGDVCRLALAASHGQLQSLGGDKLQAALSDHYQRPVRLKIEVVRAPLDTPASESHRARERQQRDAEASIKQDRFVRDAQDILGAEIIDSSIKSLT